MHIIPVEFPRNDLSKSGRTSADNDKFQASVDYVGILFEESIVRLNKNLNSESIVYLHPLNQDISPSLYHDMYWTTNHVLKDPFWLKNIRNQWKRNLLNLMPKTVVAHLQNR